jgi:hypothetical protein
MLATVLSSRLGRGVMSMPRRLGHSAILMPSHVSDGVVEVTWSWHVVTADDHADMTPSLIYIYILGK